MDWANCAPTAPTPIIVQEIRRTRDGRPDHRVIAIWSAILAFAECHGIRCERARARVEVGLEVVGS